MAVSGDLLVPQRTFHVQFVLVVVVWKCFKAKLSCFFSFFYWTLLHGCVHAHPTDVHLHGWGHKAFYLPGGECCKDVCMEKKRSQEEIYTCLSAAREEAYRLQRWPSGASLSGASA